jgi:AcrR family transcriptional regulator
MEASRRSPRAERRVATRDAIVAGTISLVAERGYAGASMHEVARRAGVATGTLYRHFASKGELLAHVVREVSGHELGIVRAIAVDPAQPVVRRLEAAVETFARRALAAPTLAHALMAEPVDPVVDTARLAARRAYEEMLATLLEEGIAAGELRARDAELAAAAIGGALQEVVLGPVGRRRGDAAVVRGLVSFVLDAVGARREPA